MGLRPAAESRLDWPGAESPNLSGEKRFRSQGENSRHAVAWNHGSLPGENNVADGMGAAAAALASGVCAVLRALLRREELDSRLAVDNILRQQSCQVGGRGR